MMGSRRFIVGRAESGRTVAEFLAAHLRLGKPAARELVRQHRVRVAGALCLDPARRVRGGQHVEVRVQTPPARPARTKSAKAARARPALGAWAPVVRYADEQVVVVDKPAGLTTMRHEEEAAEFGARARRYLPATLADLLPGLLKGGGRVRAVHRLDRDTSGLVVFARTPGAERSLGRQFRRHTTQRVYLGVVRGRAKTQRIESWLVRDRGDGRRGSSGVPGEGQHAVTHVRVVEELGEFTLVECRLETGRTHQVRIHLGEAGTPLCGERVYDRPPNGKPVPDDSGATRTALHAATLGFTHPATGARVEWTSPLPEDMEELVRKLRARARGASPLDPPPRSR